MAHRIPVPSPVDLSRPFTDARRRESGTRVRSIRNASGDAQPVTDHHAATIDIYPDEEEVSQEVATTGEVVEHAPLSDEVLEARLLFQTRASAERRLAASQGEDEKATRRVHATECIERTLTNMCPPPPPPPEETPRPVPPSSRNESLRVIVDLSSFQRTARIRLRRRRTVRALALVGSIAALVWFGLVLRTHDPGFARTRLAIVEFAHTTFTAR